MNNIKLAILVFGGCILLVVLMALGLSKLSTGTGAGQRVDINLLTDGARWVQTNGETKVTVVEFSDIQCPACKTAEPVAKQLREMDGVKFVYRHFPLITIHKNSWKGARALEAARLVLEDKEWQMMEIMFENQDKWAAENNPDNLFVGYAKSIGVDEKSFADKYKSDESDQLVNVDYSLGNKLTLSGTPTFFVNGEQTTVPAVLDKVKELLK